MGSLGASRGIGQRAPKGPGSPWPYPLEARGHALDPGRVPIFQQMPRCRPSKAKTAVESAYDDSISDHYELAMILDRYEVHP